MSTKKTRKSPNDKQLREELRYLKLTSVMEDYEAEANPSSSDSEGKVG